MQREIASQGAIFGAATHAICWLNDVEDWRGLRVTIQWLSLIYLRDSDTSEGNLSRDKVNLAWTRVDELARQDHDGLGFYEAAPDMRSIVQSNQDITDRGTSIALYDGGRTRCGWFSSLWTLQEAVLRPDMILCDRNWKELRLYDDPKSPLIPIDYILALVDCFLYGTNSYTWKGTTDPQGVNALVMAIQDAGLMRLTNEHTPLGILAASDRRQCTGRRAEAIMSVVGATRWYSDLPDDLHEKDLVWGMYPILFLREVRENIGAAFFTSQYLRYSAFWDVYEAGDTTWVRQRGQINTAAQFLDIETRGIPQQGLDAHAIGTLLPFNPLRAGKIFNVRLPEGIDNPDVVTWKLGDDGRVLMERVSLLASTDSSLFPKDREDARSCWNIRCPLTDSPRRMRTTRGADTHEFLHALFPENQRVKHAVVILEDPRFYFGIILMQVYDQEEPRKTFAKLGEFSLATEWIENVHTASRRVQWEVL